jgi:hypothetical protein
MPPILVLTFTPDVFSQVKERELFGLIFQYNIGKIVRIPYVTLCHILYTLLQLRGFEPS